MATEIDSAAALAVHYAGEGAGYYQRLRLATAALDAVHVLSTEKHVQDLTASVLATLREAELAEASAWKGRGR